MNDDYSSEGTSKVDWFRKVNPKVNPLFILILACKILFVTFITFIIYWFYLRPKWSKKFFKKTIAI